MKFSIDEYKSRCTEIGIDVNSALLHQKRLMNAIQSHSHAQVFEVVDTCRLDNGGLLPHGWPFGGTSDCDFDGYVAFVLAAGAGSRYFQPLHELNSALGAFSGESLPNIAVRQAAMKLRDVGALEWPLSKSFKEAIIALAEGNNMRSSTLVEVRHSINLPKALLPCVREEMTFFEIKHREHLALGCLDGQAFVVPHQMTAKFEGYYETFEKNDVLKTVFLEQGPRLSTLRFYNDGTPVVEGDGTLSMVPAGHGSLISLFPEVAKGFEQAHSLFIRNIDNLMGTASGAKNETLLFLKAHMMVRERLCKIRRYFERKDIKNAAEIAQELSGWVKVGNQTNQMSKRFLDSIDEPAIRVLWEVMINLFHTCPETRSSENHQTVLKGLYSRPLNALAEVPNTGRDMGGTPVFVKTKQGIQKVCLEIPHASEADRKKFFADAKKATHFNPVFIASEIRDDEGRFIGSYNLEESPFWLLAAKVYRGKNVYYHETLLSELLGNSMGSNTIFIETPRLLFNPHKSLEDAKGKSIADWS